MDCRLQVAALRQVNRRLWEATDALRANAQKDRTKYTTWDLAEAAVDILTGNDERARLVEGINKMVGDFEGAEKL